MYELRFINPTTGLRQTRYFHHYGNLEDFVRKFNCPLSYEVKDDDEDDFQLFYYPGKVFEDLFDTVNNIYYEISKLDIRER